MRVLCAGPESSGTRMLAALLTKAGADVVHHSPNYRMWDGYEPHKAKDFDAVVILVRNGYTNVRSMVDSEHAENTHRGKVMQARGLLTILENLQSFFNVYIVTLEALIHEPEALPALCRELGLPEHFAHDPIKDCNAKYYGGCYFRDTRDLEERIGP